MINIKKIKNIKKHIHSSSNPIAKYKLHCDFDGCLIRPSYNFIGEKYGRFCTNHKEIHMVNVVSKRCEIDGCIKQPCFNFSGEKYGRFCSTHKEKNMINVKHDICENTECNSRVVYGWLGKKARYCTSHKQKGEY